MTKNKESIFQKITLIIPGLSASLIVALIAKFIEGLLPVHVIGSSVIALFIGIIINSFYKSDKLEKGLKFTSKKILKFAIVILGCSLSIGTVMTIGKLSITVMVFTLLTCFGGGYIVGKILKLNWKLSNLISAGTGICGGSAIAAIAPAIEAEDKDIAYAISATFLFDMFMIFLFPILGKWLGLTDMAYGLWAGTAVNDTSSVVAAGYAFSETAGDFATMVKLTRTLSIIPIVVMFAFINYRVNIKNLGNSCVNTNNDKNNNVKVLSDNKKGLSYISKICPWFILGFVALAIINNYGLIPDVVSSFTKEASKFLMVIALSAIGLNTNFNDMRKSGIAPMIHGFIISLLVVIVAITVEYFMGII